MKKGTTVRKFSWSTPSAYPLSAQIVGDWAYALPDRRPEAVVEAASDPSCVVHELFNWDDTTAAHEHRLNQARLLFSRLKVEVIVQVRKKPKTFIVRAICRTSRKGDYDDFDTAFSTPVKRDYVLAQALAQLAALQRRYQALEELSGIFAEFDKVDQRYRKKKRV